MRYTISLERCSVAGLEVGSVTSMAVSRRCLSEHFGPFLVRRSSVRLKIQHGCTAVCKMTPSWNSRTDILAARVITGLGTGALNAITPVWATETASHTSRGAFVSLEFTLNIFGVVVAYWIEFGTSKYHDQESSFIWRFPIAFQIIPLAVLAVIVWFMPESPVLSCPIT